MRLARLLLLPLLLLLSVPLQLLLLSVPLLAPAMQAGELTVYAAASLTDAMKEIAVKWEQGGGDKLVFNFAASSTLEQQIAQGAPADLFISADEAKMDALARAGLLAPGTRLSLLSNTLVVITPADSTIPLRRAADLAGPQVKMLALAQPDTVPAGIYAREYLQAAGVWEAVRAKVIPTENVRAALAAITAGNADAGIVYKTDAATTRAVKIAWEVPPEQGPRISYPIAVLQAAPNPAAARKFMVWLAVQPEAAAIFSKAGFRVLHHAQP